MPLFNSFAVLTITKLGAEIKLCLPPFVTGEVYSYIVFLIAN